MACFVYHPEYYADIGAHVLQVYKYRKTYERLQGAEILDNEFIEPPAATFDELCLVHTREYIGDIQNAVHTSRTLPSELPLTEEIACASFLAAGGTIQAAREALSGGRALNLTGGFHHAFPDRAEGFCYINDLAMGVRVLQSEGLIRRAAVIDCDLHQGNGTAFIFRNDESVFTFSIHQENLYPLKQKSDLDIGLSDLADDSLYLPHMREQVPRILESHQPDIVFYQAGADPFSGDQLGSLQLSKEGLRERDEIVVGECRRRGIPVAGTLGGGYAANPGDTVDIHLQTAMVFWKA